jgi:hypothetical protein
MKQCVSRSAVLCFVLALMLGGHSLAKGRKSLTIYEKSRLNDVVLEPGDYKVEIVESGGSADVMIFKGKELVAKAAAQPEKLERKADRNTLRFAVESNKAPRSSSFGYQATPNLTNSATEPRLAKGRSERCLQSARMKMYPETYMMTTAQSKNFLMWLKTTNVS